MKVGLFVTCLVDLVRPNIGFAALKLLEDAGCEVIVPAAQTCCGQPGYNSGARTFSIKLGEISTRMADNKCVNIGMSGAGAVVGGDLGCLLNIEGRLRRNGDMNTKVLHFAEVAAGMVK